MKVKIKEVDNKILVSVPYKNGTVTWQLNWGNFNSISWGLANHPAHYNPARIVSAHTQFLNGNRVYCKLVRYAAASHKWNLLKHLKDWKWYK